MYYLARYIARYAIQIIPVGWFTQSPSSVLSVSFMIMCDMVSETQKSESLAYAHAYVTQIQRLALEVLTFISPHLISTKPHAYLNIHARRSILHVYNI